MLINNFLITEFRVSHTARQSDKENGERISRDVDIVSMCKAVSILHDKRLPHDMRYVDVSTLGKQSIFLRRHFRICLDLSVGRWNETHLLLNTI